MKQVSGECKFCHQVRVVQVPDNYNEKDIETEVTKKCICEEARAEQMIQDIIACTESTIRQFFKDKDMELFEKTLLSIVEPMARWQVKKISMNAQNFTVSMKRKIESIEVCLRVVNEEKAES